jgi:hypothetical protein
LPQSRADAPFPDGSLEDDTRRWHRHRPGLQIQEAEQRITGMLDEYEIAWDGRLRRQGEVEIQAQTADVEPV